MSSSNDSSQESRGDRVHMAKLTLSDFGLNSSDEESAKDALDDGSQSDDSDRLPLESSAADFTIIPPPTIEEPRGRPTENNQPPQKTDFEFLSVLGYGGYGTVFQVKKLTQPDEGVIMAMKVQNKAGMIGYDKSIAHTVTERNILARVNHPFIAELKYAFQTDKKLYLVFPYLAGGEMFGLLECVKCLYEEVARFYLGEITLALEYLHGLGIIYRDLKPENVMLDKDGHVKLIDFGLSKDNMDFLDHTDKTHTFCGTAEYMAPEIMTREGHTKDVDWWSFGILMYDMLTGSPPFICDDPKDKEGVERLVKQGRFTFPDGLTDEAKDLMTKLLKVNPSHRLGHGVSDAAQIKNHAFFKKVDWRSFESKSVYIPLVPELESEDDTSQFHERFTRLDPVDVPCTEELTESELDSVRFRNFSYVAPSDSDSEDS